MKTALTIGLCLALMPWGQTRAQTFGLVTVSDSLSTLTLDNGTWKDQWQLPYPVYQFQTGDVDGDGSIDAMVGVIKSTRFYPEIGRRLFIFKQKNGRIRPLWMGSRLGGILVDFRFTDGRIRSLETSNSHRWYVADYAWSSFGMVFERFLASDTDESTARKAFTATSPSQAETGKEKPEIHN